MGRAAAIARRESDQALEMRTLANATDAHFHHLRWTELHENVLRVAELAQRVNDPQSEVVAHHYGMRALVYRGDYDRSKGQAKVMLAAAERWRHRSWLGQALGFHGYLAQLWGEWEETRAFLDRSLALLPQDPRFLCWRTVVEYEAGDFNQGQVYLEKLLDTTRRSPMGAGFARPALGLSEVARITGEASQLKAAEELAQSVLSLPAVFPWYANMARAALGLVAVQRGDIATAQEQYAALEALPSILVHYITSDRLLGLLARTMGQLDRAVNHFQDALAFCKQAGYRPELAWVCYDCAGALLERNGPGDPEEAASLMEKGRSIAHGLGMGHLTQKLVALPQQAQSTSAHRPEYPDGLTEREVEVLRIMAAGRSNSEIAEDLVLSIRTVERHITSIYTKANARNRAGATAYAFSHGLAG